MPIKHAFVTTRPDDPNSDVSADEWNADHVIEGPLLLAADPSNPMDAVTKQYVDSKPSGATISEAAPANPFEGMLWWSSANGNLYIRFGTAWVQVNTVGS